MTFQYSTLGGRNQNMFHPLSGRFPARWGKRTNAPLTKKVEILGAFMVK
jgi:hypothetical protein